VRDHLQCDPEQAAPAGANVGWIPFRPNVAPTALRVASSPGTSGEARIERPTSMGCIELRANECCVDDPTTDEVGAVVRRLARPHASGGTVIERSVIIAEGTSSAAILSWISAHRGIGDSTASRGAARSTGLHGSRTSGAPGQEPGPARRFVLPADAFD
jgi:hypothetical protein